MLKEFLFRRPSWFQHEGFWRLAQVARLGIPCGVALLYAFVFFVYGLNKPIYFVGVVAAIAAGFVLLLIIHGLLRIAVWIADGFKKTAH
jgi:hypothetical protein